MDGPLSPDVAEHAAGLELSTYVPVAPERSEIAGLFWPLFSVIVVSAALISPAGTVTETVVMLVVKLILSPAALLTVVLLGLKTVQPPCGFEVRLIVFVTP